MPAYGPIRPRPLCPATLTSREDPLIDGYATHDLLNQHLLNQPGPLHDIDLFAGDQRLQGAVRTFGAAWAAPRSKRNTRLVRQRRSRRDTQRP